MVVKFPEASSVQPLVELHKLMVCTPVPNGPEMSEINETFPDGTIPLGLVTEIVRVTGCPWAPVMLAGDNVVEVELKVVAAQLFTRLETFTEPNPVAMSWPAPLG